MRVAPAGQMRHVITVQEKTETVDPISGVRSISWADKYADIPAAFRELTAREQQVASARNSSVSCEFEIRADFEISAKDRIVFEGEVYEIDPPIYDPTRRRRCKIRAARGMTNG